MHRSLFVVVIFASTLRAAPARAESARPVVAVFTLQSKGVALDASTRDRLSEYLTTRLAASGRYQVIPRADLKTRLSAQKKASYRSCYDSACQIEIGKELAAEKSLTASVIRMGTRCIMTIALYDLRRAATDGAATTRSDCQEEALSGAIDRVVAQLAGAKAPPDKPASLPKTPVVMPATPPALPTRPPLGALRERTEWLTATVLPGLIIGPGAGLAIAGGALSAFTLKWQLFGGVYLAWTPLEVLFTHAISEEKVLLGTLSTSIGGAIFFGDGANHQLRLNLVLGGGAAGNDVGFIPAGEAEYRYQTDGRFFFGIGGRLVLPTFRSSDTTRGGYYPAAGFLLLRFGWAAKP